jgi:hypothetical protein
MAQLRHAERMLTPAGNVPHTLGKTEGSDGSNPRKPI